MYEGNCQNYIRTNKNSGEQMRNRVFNSINTTEVHQLLLKVAQGKTSPSDAQSDLLQIILFIPPVE